MPKSRSDKIIIKRLVDYPFENAILSEIASPGHLVELLSDGTIRLNDSGFADGIGILIENESVGGDKETAYASGDIATYSDIISGMIVQCRVAASTSAITFGDRLQVINGGTVARLPIQADLTDSTTGTVSGTLNDVTSSFDQDILNNNFASIASDINALLPAGLGYIGIALESVDNSAGAGEVFIKVKIK